MSNWMRTKMFQHSPGDVCTETNTVKNVAVCTMGEAKGHGVYLDSEFIDEVVSQGNEKNHGLKARFGHPSMCSTALGTYLGTFKNFHRDGDIARADLHISKEANNSPNGRLGDYVMGMAENAPESFGTSICFTPGDTYRLDENGEKVYSYEFETMSEGLSDELYIELASLHGCDAVDEPAANDGLFSGETIAGQLEVFFQDYPEVFEKLSASPEILDAISKYGKNVNQFIEAYQERLATQTITKTKDHKVTEDENKEEEVVATEEVVEEESIAEGAESTEEAQEEELASEETSEQVEDAGENTELSELTKTVAEFGADVATEAFSNGGGYAEAQKIAFDRLREENEQLAKQLSAKKDTSAAVPHSPEISKRSLFNTQK